jgi:hypothetical protein
MPVGFLKSTWTLPWGLPRARPGREAFRNPTGTSLSAKFKISIFLYKSESDFLTERKSFSNGSGTLADRTRSAGRS